MKTEAVHPEKWEEHTRNEVLALVDEYIRWYNHERIKQSLGWMSPVQYRQSQGMEYSCRMNQIEANRVL